ncbi:alpha/beta hydrolase family protein [Humisphaera borealis]|uniref:Alpha/beta fold hydrolase n=1 Tax=Humisphaera borealis TaxID=2807512 RepID=A0A7M2X341_9BACT|nr:alpha/beta fold hydrolase [Humisphaera borealis]QOV92197.1 alpha/beta fold hydrolase [Humisphaera borealis]
MPRLLVVSLVFAIGAMVAAAEPPKGWSPGVTEVLYRSDADNTDQPALWYSPATADAVPLLVCLHTWSSNYLTPEKFYADWCIDKGWAMVRPNFRGPNSTPAALGSELAVKDVIAAVAWAKTQRKIDPDRIYLIGGSGGGHMSLQMAGRAPELWAGVSAWCPISDVARWHADSKRIGNKYWQMMEKACGGAPGTSPEIDTQYKHRSPLTHLPAAKGLNLTISTGIEDGHKGSVPVGHTLRAFNAVAADADKVSDADIAAMEAKPVMPATLLQTIVDPTYGENKPLFRRVSGNAQVTIFQGGHNILPEAGLMWLEKQRKGKPAVWEVGAGKSASKATIAP